MQLTTVLLALVATTGFVAAAPGGGSTKVKPGLLEMVRRAEISNLQERDSSWCYAHCVCPKTVCNWLCSGDPPAAGTTYNDDGHTWTYEPGDDGTESYDCAYESSDCDDACDGS